MIEIVRTFKNTHQRSLVLKVCGLISCCLMSRFQFTSHVINNALNFLLDATADQYFPFSPIKLISFFESFIFFFHSLQRNIKSFSEFFITHLYELNNVVQCDILLYPHKQLSSGSDCGKLILQQLKSLLIDGKLHSVLNENQFGLQTADRTKLI